MSFSATATSPRSWRAPPSRGPPPPSPTPSWRWPRSCGAASPRPRSPPTPASGTGTGASFPSGRPWPPSGRPTGQLRRSSQRRALLPPPRFWTGCSAWWAKTRPRPMVIWSFVCFLVRLAGIGNRMIVIVLLQLLL